MAIADSSKVDLLYKKLFGVAKSDTPTVKSLANEATASFSLLRGDKILAQSGSIPATPPGSTTSVVEVYTGTASDKCTPDTTTSVVNGSYVTWLTGLTDWISPEFGSQYFVKVYADLSSNTNPQTTGTQLDANTSGSEWWFDYQAGTLHFIGGTPPTILTGKVIWIVGYRYIGSFGLAASGFTGTLGVTNGGTGSSAYLIGSILYASGTTALTQLTPNSTTTTKFLSQSGDNTLANAPAWYTLSASDVGLGTSSTPTFASVSTGSVTTTNVSTFNSVGIGSRGITDTVLLGATPAATALDTLGEITIVGAGVAATATGTGAIGRYSTLIGSSANSGSTTVGIGNIALGWNAGYSSTGSGNIFVGTQAGTTVTTGINNIIISNNWTSGATPGLTTGSGNVILGNISNGISSTSTNTIYLADGVGNLRLKADSTGVTIPNLTTAGVVTNTSAGLLGTVAKTQSGAVSSLVQTTATGGIIATGTVSGNVVSATTTVTAPIVSVGTYASFAGSIDGTCSLQAPASAGSNRVFTLPNSASGSLIGTGDSGTVSTTMLAAVTGTGSVVLNSAPQFTGSIVVNSGRTGFGIGIFSFTAGSSNNLFANSATSGTVSSYLPQVTGTLIGTGDTATVSNTMLATVGVSKGGTGLTSLPMSAVPVGNGTNTAETVQVAQADDASTVVMRDANKVIKVSNVVQTGYQLQSSVASYAVPITCAFLEIGGNTTTAVITLPTGTTGKTITIRNLSATQTVTSHLPNVYPKAGGTSVAAILPAGIGNWAMLVYTGANWQIFASEA